MKIDLTRFKNYGLWVSIFALIPIILSAFGVDIIPEEYQVAVNAILGVMVALGIVNNPTTEDRWYEDDTISKEEVEEIEEPKQ